VKRCPEGEVDLGVNRQTQPQIPNGRGRRRSSASPVQRQPICALREYGQKQEVMPAG
jgi:hypothetical protein